MTQHTPKNWKVERVLLKRWANRLRKCAEQGDRDGMYDTMMAVARMIDRRIEKLLETTPNV
jgi:hypothetical protein